MISLMASLVTKHSSRAKKTEGPSKRKLILVNRFRKKKGLGHSRTFSSIFYQLTVRGSTLFWQKQIRNILSRRECKVCVEERQGLNYFFNRKY